MGCGQIAEAHWSGIQNHAPQVEVTAAVDIDAAKAEAMAARTGGQAFLSLDEALQKGDFDAVDLMLPHNLHVEAALKSFDAGKHVLLEKPMAMDLQECETILRAAEAADGLFMIAEQAQYWPDVHAAADLMAAGEIGEVVTARATFYDIVRWQPGDPIPWRFELAKSGGGIAMDGGAHWIRPLRIWFGDVEEVIGAVAHPIGEMEPESLANAILRFKGSVTAMLTVVNTYARTAPLDAFRITGTKGEISIEHGRDGRMLLFNPEHPDGKEIMKTAPGKIASYGLELRDFSDAVLHGTELQAPPEYSLGELKTALAIYRSVESRTWEKVG